MILFQLLFPLAIGQQAINHKSLSIGQPQQGYVGPDNIVEGLFSLIVPIMTPTSALVFMLKSVNPDADPNIYISSTIQNPQSQSEADIMVCQAKGIDTCVLRSDQVIAEEVIYIAVVSETNCYFSLRVDLDEELILKQNDFLQFKMNNTQQSKIIEFNIGELLGNETEIEIVITALNFKEMDEPFHVYMNRAENQLPSNEKYDFIANDLDDTKQFELHIAEIHAFDSFYILIEAPQGAIFEVQTLTNSNVKELSSFEKKHQLVKKEDCDFYKLILNEELLKHNPDYVIYILIQEIILIPYEGFASLFVNPNIQPPLLDNYYYQENVTKGESIVLKPSDFSEQLTQFYIAVYGIELCVYTLQIVPLFGGSNNSKEIYPSIQNLRTIEKGELLKQYISLSDLVLDTTLVLNLQAINGKFLYILTNCDYHCHSFTWEDVQNSKKINSNSIVIYSKDVDFEHTKVNCMAKEPCEWRLLIVLDQNSDLNHGKIAITYNIQKEQIKLIENTPYKSYVESGQHEYYWFTIQEKPKKIKFLLTSISGHSQMYLSTSKKFPTENEYDEISNNVITIGENEKLIFKPTSYFISVKGVSASRYTITVWIIRSEVQNGQYPWNYIQLFQGNPQNQQLNNNEFGLYKIEVPYSYGSFKPVQIMLQINYGEFKILAFKRPEIETTKSDWMSESRILYISGFQSNYSDILYIRIQLSDNTYSGSYQIFYTVEYEEVQLFLGNQFYSYLRTSHHQQFFFALKQNQSIVIEKQALVLDQEKLNMSIHLNFDVVGFIQVDYSKNRNLAQISFKDMGNNQDFMTQRFCTYIQIELQTSLDLFYTLIVTEENLDMQLFQNQPITKQLLFHKDNFYLITDGKEVSVIVSSLYMELTILAKVVTDLSQSSPSLENDNYDKISMRHLQKNNQFRFNQQSSIYFSEKELANCDGFCYIKLIVFQNGNSTQDEYTIQYNSKLLLLNERQTISGSIINTGLNYYRIQLYDDDRNLMILLTPLNVCEIDIYVSKTQYPTIAEYDWSSTDYLGDALIIEAGNEKHSKMSGSYIVGVMGEDKCQFNIQYTTGNMQFYNIFNNIPQTIFIREQEIVYFRYLGDTQLPITIFLSSQSGQTVMFIEKVDSLNKNFSYLEKEIKNFTYNNQGKGFKDYIQIIELSIDSSLAIALNGAYSEEVFLQINSGEIHKSLQSGIQYRNQIFRGQELFFQLQTQSQNISVYLEINSGNVSAAYALSQDDQLKSDQFINLEIQKGFNLMEINSQGQICTIKVQCLVDSFFSIKFYSESQQPKQIKSAHASYFLLRAHQDNNFTYQSQNFVPEAQQKIFSISLGKILDSPLQKKYRNQLPQITVYGMNTQYKLTPSIFTQTQHQIQLEYEDIDSTYLILVHSNSQIDEHYYIQVGSQNIKPLVSQQKIVQSQKLKESTYWVVTPTGENDQIFYDIQLCGGLFQVFVGSDIEQLRNNQYDKQLTTNNKGKAVGVLGMSGQEIIFKLILNKLVDQYPSYTIYTYQYNSQFFFPYTQIYPDDYGALSHSIQEENGMKLLSITFAPLYYQGSNNFLLEWVDYYVLGQEATDNSINYCKEPFFNEKLTLVGHQKSQQETITVIIRNNDLLSGKQFSYTVVAYGNIFSLNQAHLRLQNDDVITLDYQYQQQSIEFNAVQQQGELFAGAIFIMVIIMIIIIVFCIQMKRKKQIEKYEAKSSANIELNYRGLSE